MSKKLLQLARQIGKIEIGKFQKDIFTEEFDWDKFHTTEFTPTKTFYTEDLESEPCLREQFIKDNPDVKVFGLSCPCRRCSVYC